eukprot:TRINITY_DN32236_c0_g1_i1.p1 TRINITY_DN32236_c0_g1~~TRINITY_DN32236_c0_g1_i1.p1  ORF type:complete len:247 (+),score=55.77 TRINITY_DN32236_c0_g1_i1:170-910(+)
MKRALDVASEGGASAARARVEAVSASEAVVRAAVAAVLKEAKGLTVRDRQAFGLDRLVLDGRCGETEVAAAALKQANGGTSGLEEFKHILSVPGAGHGLSIGVGLAIGQRHLSAEFGQPDHRSMFEHRAFVVCRASSLTSGAASEAASLAGHLQLACLLVIAIADAVVDVDSVVGRFSAYRWTASVATSNADLAAQLTQPSVSGAGSPRIVILRHDHEHCSSEAALDVAADAEAVERWQGAALKDT